MIAIDSENPIGQALHYLKLNGAFYCKSDLAGDWGISLPSMPDTSMFHIVTAGSCVIEHGDQQIELNAGDFVFLSKGDGHILRSKPEAPAEDLFSYPVTKISDCYETLEIGQEGNKTTMLCGVVQLEHPSASFIIDSMPSIIHLQCSKSSLSSWMSQTVHLIATEAERADIGGETVLTRLADVLVIQALRHWITNDAKAEKGWLYALKDQRIGKSLSLIHSNPGASWTIESLGKEIGMSRTAFANKFKSLVGEPMLQYLTNWRMNLAAMKIKDGEKVTLDFIEELGYKSESSFRRTFKKVMGINVGEVKAIKY